MTKASATPALLPNAFIGKARKPSAAELAAALGPTAALWDQLLSDLADELGTDTHLWHSYSTKAGWALKVQRGARTILYLGPCHGVFRVSFILGEQALKAARQSGLPPAVLKLIAEAKKYPEGTAVRLSVTSAADIGFVKKIAQAKIEH